jgi:hypothetical protein
MSKDSKDLCTGCEVLDHLAAIGKCFSTMADEYPEVVTPAKLKKASHHLNGIAALIAKSSKHDTKGMPLKSLADKGKIPGR